MANRVIKPDASNDLLLQNNGGGTSIEIPNSGDISITGTIGSGTFNGIIGTSATGLIGIKVADQWRLHTGFTGTADPIASNLERNDTKFAQIGSGMTESSGVFTFPETGIYFIDFAVTFSLDGDARYIGQSIKHDDGTVLSKAYTSITRTSSSTTYTQAYINYVFDCASTSTDKVKFSIPELASSSVATVGSHTSMYTYFTFIRLGDT
tara:strand:- start:751 stop:1374 length:624 start_codon:yes stop_codon:yes gene_type:complete